MNIFKQQLQDKQSARIAKEQKVIEISNKISNLIGIRPESSRDLKEDLVFEQLKHYDIRAENRCFTHDWVMVWEIVPKGYPSAGYSNTQSPEWVTGGGTACTNIPPPYCVKAVLDQLERMTVSA